MKSHKCVHPCARKSDILLTLWISLTFNSFNSFMKQCRIICQLKNGPTPDFHWPLSFTRLFQLHSRKRIRQSLTSTRRGSSTYLRFYTFDPWSDLINTEIIHCLPDLQEDSVIHSRLSCGSEGVLLTSIFHHQLAWWQKYTCNVTHTHFAASAAIGDLAWTH